VDQFGLPEHRIVSHDGTRIAYWISRPPPDKDTGIALAFSNGIGISRIVWQDYLAALRHRFTVMFWDYRSFYRSDRPADLHRLAIEDHARDLAAILEAEDLTRTVLVGWSMGVQVSIEAWEHARARIAGLVLMNGTAGRTFDTAFGLPGLIYWVPPVTRFLSRQYPHHLNRIMPYVFRKDTAKALKVTGVVGPTIDLELLGRILDEYGTHDYGIYFHLLNELGYHAPDHLESIDVPALVLVGGRDAFTPPVTGKKLRHRLKNAELEQIDDGTHYMLMEFPAKIRARLEQFVEARVLARGPAPEAAGEAAEAGGEPDWTSDRQGARTDQAGSSRGARADQAGSSREARARRHERRSFHRLLTRTLRRPP
jgi:pimeloyl-ACP methyl ester carboxylesterase